MVVVCHLHSPPLIGKAALCPILAKMLKEGGDRILRHLNTGIVFATKVRLYSDESLLFTMEVIVDISQL